jgi:hypothetical protein
MCSFGSRSTKGRPSSELPEHWASRVAVSPGHVPNSVLCRPGFGATIASVGDEIDREDLRAIILALMRIEEKLDELLGEDDDDGEEEDFG